MWDPCSWLTVDVTCYHWGDLGWKSECEVFLLELSPGSVKM